MYNLHIIPFGCFHSLRSIGIHPINVNTTVAEGGTFGRNAKADCCTNPEVEPSGTSKSGFNFFAIIARHRSRKQYRAQKLGAQYACVRPLWIGTNLCITISSCPWNINGPNDNRNPRMTVTANFTRLTKDFHLNE